MRVLDTKTWRRAFLLLMYGTCNLHMDEQAAAESAK